MVARRLVLRHRGLCVSASLVIAPPVLCASSCVLVLRVQFAVAGQADRGPGGIQQGRRIGIGAVRVWLPAGRRCLLGR